MSHDAGEVSWQTLRRIVHGWSGDAAELEQVTALDGGSISTTLLLATNSGERAVLKVSPHRVDRSYQREAHQLDLLRSLGLPAPRVLECHVGTLDSPDSYLLIEFLPGVNLTDAKRQCTPQQFDALQEQLAQTVLTMHAQTAAKFGRVDPAAPQGDSSWPAFYRQTYDAIWHECEKHANLPVKPRKTIAKIHERLDRWLTRSDPPRLIHGDLWSSNVLAAADGDGKWHITGLLDPNCKFADAECEMAYLDLFHTTTPAFNNAYQQTLKLDDEYHRVRKHVYQLYELVNHVNLFGERYLKPLQATLEKLSPAI